MNKLAYLEGYMMKQSMASGYGAIPKKKGNTGSATTKQPVDRSKSKVGSVLTPAQRARLYKGMNDDSKTAADLTAEPKKGWIVPLKARQAAMRD